MSKPGAELLRTMLARNHRLAELTLEPSFPLGRFETLQQDFDKVCQWLGFEDSKLPHRNPSNKKSRNLKRKVRNALFLNGEDRKKHWTEFYDQRTLDAVSRLYEKDIEAFGYRFERP